MNNFVPLLFLMFHGSYGIPMTQITLLITFNFGLQLLGAFWRSLSFRRYCRSESTCAWRVIKSLREALPPFRLLALRPAGQENVPQALS